jgi:DNA polymerase
MIKSGYPIQIQSDNTVGVSGACSECDREYYCIRSVKNTSDNMYYRSMSDKEMREQTNMKLDKLREIADTCTQCELCEGRDKAVFARGNPNSSIMICGMCPGPDENKEGYPFVEYAAAGSVLNEILMRVFGNTDSVYITNLVKCFVQPGKPLQPAWMNACLPYLIVQIQIINPRIIIALGKDVCNYLLDNDMAMGQMRGKIYPYMGRHLLCTYHPSYLARAGGVKHKHFDIVVKDFIKSKEFVNDL